MRSRMFRDEGGFTLIEVLMAASILLVGILGVTTIVNVANGTTTSSKAREQGVALARDLIESAHSVRYQALRPSNVVGTLQAMPGLANAGAGPGWTIKRRGIVYTVSVGVCSADDPGDKTGAHAANTFCVRPAVQAAPATCESLIGSPANIAGTGGASGADAGDCGLDTDHDGRVDGLVQSAASDCPTGTSIAAGTCDAQPDDFKRVVTLVTWDRGSGSRYVLQEATIPFPGLSAYGKITSLTLNGSSPGSDGSYTVAGTPSSLTFAATSDQPATQADWLLGGVDQGPFASWSGSSGWFSWALGDAPPGETTPTSAEVLDGTYVIGARIQDAGGIHGVERDVSVVLNRRIPFPPPGFTIAGSAFDAQGRPTQVTASWSAPPDHDIVGYTLWRQPANGTWSTVGACTGITTRTCTDSNPPMGSVSYYVTALDRDPSTGATRYGQPSAVRSIDIGNQPPTVPTFTSSKVTGTSGGSKVQLWWTASTDPDDAVDSYEIYRSGCTSATLVGTALGTATTLTDTSAPKNKSCIYNIRAKDVGGAFSALSPDYAVLT